MFWDDLSGLLSIHHVVLLLLTFRCWLCVGQGTSSSLGTESLASRSLQMPQPIRWEAPSDNERWGWSSCPWYGLLAAVLFNRFKQPFRSCLQSNASWNPFQLTSYFDLDLNKVLSLVRQILTLFSITVYFLFLSLLCEMGTIFISYPRC